MSVIDQARKLRAVEKHFTSTAPKPDFVADSIWELRDSSGKVLACGGVGVQYVAALLDRLAADLAREREERGLDQAEKDANAELARHWKSAADQLAEQRKAERERAEQAEREVERLREVIGGTLYRSLLGMRRAAFTPEIGSRYTTAIRADIAQALARLEEQCRAALERAEAGKEQP